ncbi:efflux transporter, RND family, MFP subunit [Thermoclostridium stercorarium subsp. stercorarium DSM 8532]|uniref:Efflux transporter, RND family, MFP subunit n=2 Tax=Thermoclostridium stercorarium TaxID=1510 RepID=L7VVZ8_THES1|nr:HlyD family efflux transporter periplasmic adaptor subunit [Thermoclostridium stercorarium]AGC69708.1 efflux transporter, RND family, MFP subunit [Thermoclostridium stercorarium subsp. stercorarium DSM 8532]AGI40660.1 efflux pump [Thermoclostridium stercorarium subsp. stercorarium DSM 8532]ANW99924.1 MFP transporter [Thermoclostridium stercorarium subsp. thermolacticum DSM 2910]UZQ85642.1 efflux RND transporter periplasmic adaptor subunit [Thermoclostridium stercorarium]
MKKKTVAITVLVIAIIALMIFLNLNKNNDLTVSSGVISKKNAISVKATTIETGTISSYVSAPGQVKEVNKAQIFFDTPLRVLNVFVDKYDLVQEGDRLVELDVSTLTDELERLKIQKEIQSITLKKLESGQNLLSLETNLASARNAYTRAEDAYNSALEEYNKQLKLYESGVISEAQLKQYDQALKDAKSALDNAQINLESAEKSYDSSVSSHDLDIQAQVKNVELLSRQIAEIERKLSKIKSLEKSPITGYVTEIYLTEGGYTVTGQPAFTIIDSQNLEISATVDEYNSKDILPGQKVRITGDALGENVELAGEVISVAPVATKVQSTSGTQTVIEVIIEPKEGFDVLKPGLNVDCEIITHEKSGIPVAEFNIFLEDKDKNQYVMLIDKDNMTVHQKYVTLGIYSDMLVEIMDGLEPGDMVVVDPQPSLKDGDRVKVVE